jgi:hypothetical protein
MRCQAILAFMLLLLALAPVRAGRVVVMRGVATNSPRDTFRQVGDETTLSQVILSGVNGQEVLDANRQKLKQEVELYEAAQRVRGIDPPEPLYVLIDPNETWVKARFGSPFTVVGTNGKKTRVTSGFIQLGEKVDFIQQAFTRELSREANRALLTLVNEYYMKNFVTHDHRGYVQALFASAPCAKSLPIVEEPWPAFVKRLRAIYSQLDCNLKVFDTVTAEFEKRDAGKKETFEAQVNRRFKFGIKGLSDTTLAVYVNELPHEQFVAEITQLVKNDLAARGVTATGPVLDTAETRAVTAGFRKKSTLSGLNEALAHELGHMIHFQAGNGLGFGPISTGEAPGVTDHSATTLSNPAFALVEGLAEAAAFTYAAPPQEADRRRAQIIDYSASVTRLQTALNNHLLQKVGTELRAKGLLNGPIAMAGTLADPPDAFASNLREAAVKLGLEGSTFDTVARGVNNDPALADQRRRYLYTNHLQAHAGEKKRRADMLSSESSVAYNLYMVNQALSGSFFADALPIIKEQHPASMAALLEAFVAKYPQAKLKVYEALTGASDGVLVTKAQLELVRANPRLEIDLDRDGQVPGTSAASVKPELFPRETNTFGPVPGLDGKDPLVPATNSARERTVTTAAASDHRIPWNGGMIEQRSDGPDMTDINRR